MNLNRLVFLVSAVILSACSGSDNSETNTVPTSTASPSSLQLGTFVGAPVEGLRFAANNSIGHTDSQGRFIYQDNQPVSFSIGSIELGNAIGARVITPYSLTNENANNGPGTQAVNIARLLQSLDEEPSNDVTIKIPEALQDLDIDDIDFSDEDDLNRVLDAASDLTSTNYILANAITAEESLRRSTDIYNQYDQIVGGHFTRHGTNWYVLTMPEPGNLAIGMSGFSVSIHVHDTDLNPVNLFENSSSTSLTNSLQPGVVPFQAGTYLLKITMDDYSGVELIDINSLVLIDQTVFPDLGTGTYSSELHKVEWYVLELSQDANVDFQLSGFGTRVNLYDSQLNPINFGVYSNPSSINSVESGVVRIEAGTYMVRFMLPGGTRGSSIVVNSPMLPKKS